MSQPEPPEINLEPRDHSHLYELKPMSRWWLVVVLCLCALAAFVNGLEKVATWALLLFGAGLGFALILVFPRHWLSRIG